jgi:beta-lactam-binding protein with PASTA domain
VAGQTYSETVPLDAIVSTEPQAADGIRPGGSVDAIVSLGPERYDVPAVKGLDPAEAEAAIAAAKLTVGPSVAVFDTKVPDGAVVGTSPKAGESVKPGTSVEVLISKGPAPVPVPDVVGARVNAAKKALTAVDLKSTTAERFSDKVANGRVISVKPKVGAVIAAGSSVELVVSKGPPPVTVPNLIDMPRAKAVATLERLGLRARVDAGSFTRLNRVIDQSPAAGSKVARGTRVTIKII